MVRSNDGRAVDRDVLRSVDADVEPSVCEHWGDKPKWSLPGPHGCRVDLGEEFRSDRLTPTTET